MKSVVVVYFSGSGHTHLMAEAIAEGVRQVPDVSVELVRIHGEQIVNGRWQDDRAMEKLDRADAIVFGSPTYMGGVAAQFKAFIDAASSRWFQQAWKNKIASITSGMAGSPVLQYGEESLFSNFSCHITI